METLTEGQTVTVYQDPLTETKVEGRAVLLEKIDCVGVWFNDQIIDRWLVIFDGRNDFPVERDVLRNGGYCDS
jgi:hypothetical protein